MRWVVLVSVIAVVLTILVGCSSNAADEGILIVNATGLNGLVPNPENEVLYVAVLDGSTLHGGSATVSGGSATVDSYSDGWKGRGEVQYRVVIDMDGNQYLGNAGDWATDWRKVEIDGDVTIAVSAGDFTLVP